MIYEGSRFTKTNQFDRNGTLMFEIRERVIWGKEGCSIHTYTSSDRLDLLAMHYYGNPQLYWIILDANPKYRAEWEINIGDELVIPSYEEVQKWLNNL